jgi:hypothetical protein
MPQIEQAGFRASLVAAARPPDLSDRAKHLLDSANVGEPQGNPPTTSGAGVVSQDHSHGFGRTLDCPCLPCAAGSTEKHASGLLG